MAVTVLDAANVGASGCEHHGPRRRRPPLVAYLYRIDLAKPVRPMTEAKWAALAKANTARRICPECGRDAGYVIPTSLGMCVPCAYPDEQRAA
ncbi:hypothetical protein BM536_011430 [Streptomyces phaeoluteigriseus]|uniref:Uncharacterized protein n=1 Tax=Streptomyces phaeoluteigriseus TaxID=114686 RepID=A0A1V6MS31_9ACTN|nr:RRQRL motif-containing zinc-binding protein [Streptomyces phaeoluteigriseus]OQD55258.1 hypothetical protein BM536_011430 [Streptomyces phaeoluteigriseus]